MKDRERIIALAALTLLAGCEMPTAEERARNQRISEARIAKEAEKRLYDETYDRCLYRVTGPFAAASIDVMKECERQARAATMKEKNDDPA